MPIVMVVVRQGAARQILNGLARPVRAYQPNNGRSAKVTEATEKYPFLIKLEGYYLWPEADKGGWKLDQSRVQWGIAAAQPRAP